MGLSSSLYVWQFPHEAIWSWTFVCREFLLNYRFYFTSSDQSVETIGFFLIQLRLTGCSKSPCDPPPSPGGADLNPVTNPHISFPCSTWFASDEPPGKKTLSHIQLLVHHYRTSPRPPIKCPGGGKGPLGSFVSFLPLN